MYASGLHSKVVLVAGQPFRVSCHTVLQNGKCVTRITCTVQSLGKAQPYHALAVYHGEYCAVCNAGILLHDIALGLYVVNVVVTGVEITDITIAKTVGKTTCIAHRIQNNKLSLAFIIDVCKVGNNIALKLLCKSQSVVTCAGTQLTLPVQTQLNACTCNRVATGALADSSFKAIEIVYATLHNTPQRVSAGRYGSDALGVLAYSTGFDPGITDVIYNGSVLALRQPTIRIVVHGQCTTVLAVEELVVVGGGFRILVTHQIDVCQYKGNREHSLGRVANGSSITIIVILGITPLLFNLICTHQFVLQLLPQVACVNAVFGVL